MLRSTPGGFGTTRWSLVLAAGRSGGGRFREALAWLCDAYWQPVYAVIRRQGYGADDACDLTQEFFARMLEKNYVKGADPARGRFRSFLSSSVRHFLSNERDRATAAKRGGPLPPLSLDVETAEGLYQIEPRDDLTPEKLFDRRWGLVVLERALARLRAEYVESKKAEAFDILKGLLTGEGAAATYADAGRHLNLTVGAVKVAVHRLRGRFRDALILEISETVSDPDEIDGEVQYLLKAVST